MSVTALEIVQATIKDMNESYIERIPEGTLNNVSQIGDFITSDKNVMNDFISTLINKVALSRLISKMYHNPLEKLKSQNGRPFGSTIEEVFVNPSTDMGYQKDGAYLLKTFTPDTHVAYYGLNRQGFYATSIQKDQVSLAFSSENDFMKFFNGIVTAVYSGDAMDEFNLTKKMLGKNIDEGHIKLIECDIAQPKELSKAISNIGDLMTFERTDMCPYNLINKADITAKKTTEVMTFTPLENQVLLLRYDVANEINYEVLALMFNMEVAQLKQMIIKVDSCMSNNVDTYAILCDKESIQIIDKVFETETEYNKSNRVWTMFLHHWQWLYLSTLANCVAFGKKKVGQ